MKPRDQDGAKLLRWYPRTWRERYGEEFLAMVEDSLGGRRPGWRLRLNVARAGLREQAIAALDLLTAIMAFIGAGSRGRREPPRRRVARWPGSSSPRGLTPFPS
jgi:hypothetical protein